jgi:hypothetical protein
MATDDVQALATRVEAAVGEGFDPDANALNTSP